LVEQGIRLHAAAPLFPYLTDQDSAVRGFIPACTENLRASFS